MKKWISILTAAVLTAGLAGCGGAAGTADSAGSSASETVTDAGGAETSADAAEASGELTTVRLGVMTGNPDHWLAVIGQEKGIYEEHGLNVEITQFAAGINTVDAMVTDQVDLGNLADYAAVNRIGNTQDNTDLRLVAHFTSAAKNDLYVDPEKVSELSDLAGQGFVTLPGTVWDYHNAMTYEFAGIGEEDRNLVNVDSAQAALSVIVSGDGVAFWAAGTTAQKMEEAGLVPLLSMDDLGLRTDAYIVTRQGYIDENGDVLKSYLAAFKEIEEWTVDNQEEAADIVEAQLGLSKEQFLQDLGDTTLSVDFTQDTIDHLNEIKEWAVENGRFDKDYDFNDFIDASLITE